MAVARTIITPSVNARTISPMQVTPLHILNFFAIKPTVPFPGWTIVPFLLGACSLSGLGAGGNASGGALFLVAIFVGIGVAGIYAANQPIRNYNNRETITESSFDQWIEFQKKEALTRACQRLGIEMSHFFDPGPEKQVVNKPVSIIGFVANGALSPTATIKFAVADRLRGSDNRMRWRVNRFLWLVPLEAALAVYETETDITSIYTMTFTKPTDQYSSSHSWSDQFVTMDQSSEYFYQAVSGIITGQRQIVDFGTAYVFSLSIDNGERATTTIANDISSDVQSLRTLINNKKRQMLSGGGYPPPYGYAPSGPAGYPPPGYPPSYPQGGYPPAGYPPTSPNGYPPSSPYTPGSYPPLPYPPSVMPASHDNTGSDAQILGDRPPADS